MPKTFALTEWHALEAEQLAASMLPDEKASQLIMTAIEGDLFSSVHSRDRFKDCVPGAILLFRYNIAATPRGVRDFIGETQKTFMSFGLPVLFAIDHEGGDVYRTGNVTTKLPSQLEIAERYSPTDAALIYASAARELSLLGIGWNLAPVTETGDGDNTNFLGSRIFSSDVDEVERYSIAAILGIQSSGLLATVKHFPGNTGVDPHTGISRLSMERNRFDAEIVEPFRRILNSKPAAILVSNTVVNCVDANLPFCLSPDGVTGIVRDELEYQGLILTDDLSMGALSAMGFDSAQAAVLAIEAGCDMVMISAPNIRVIRDAIADRGAVNEQFADRIDDAVKRVLRAKLAAGLPVTSRGRMASSRGEIQPLFSASLYQDARNATSSLLNNTYAGDQ